MQVPAKLAAHAGASRQARGLGTGVCGVTQPVQVQLRQSFLSAATRVPDAGWTRQLVAGEWFAHGALAKVHSRADVAGVGRHGLLRSSLAPQVLRHRQKSDRVRALASAACRAACAQPARLNGRQDRFSASSVRRKADALSSAGATSAALGLRVGGALVCRSYCESTGST